jgi:hypothetical protein
MINDLSILNKQEFGKHMKLRLKSRSKIISAIGFNMSDRINQISEKIDVAFNPIINNFNGEKKLELKLVDFKCP